MRLSLLQFTVGSNFDENFEKSKNLIQKCLTFKPELILFPECFLYLSNLKKFSIEQNHKSIIYFQQFAKENNVNILLGSLPIEENNNVYNRSLVVDSNGSIISKYDKVHMFDVILKNKELYKESDTYKPGSTL